MAVTIDDQIAASIDDGNAMDDGTFGNNDATVRIGNDSGRTIAAFFLFEDVDIPIGSIITVAYLTLDFLYNYPPVVTNIYAEKIANPTAVASRADYNGKTKTTNFVAWDGFTAGWDDSPSIISVVQEVVTAFTTDGMQFFIVDDGSAWDDAAKVTSWDSDPGQAAKVHIEYNLPSGGGGHITGGAAVVTGAGMSRLLM